MVFDLFSSLGKMVMYLSTSHDIFLFFFIFLFLFRGGVGGGYF